MGLPDGGNYWSSYDDVVEGCSDVNIDGFCDDALEFQAGFVDNYPHTEQNGWLGVAPTADAGPDQSIRAGDTVNLDGTASFDDDTASVDLDYAWAFTPTGLPPLSSAVLADASSATPSFVADVAGTYEVELIVTDEGGLESDADAVVVSSANMAPTAAAGADQLVIVGTPVFLDGSGSTDPEMDSLTYGWTFTTVPSGSAATLSGPNTAMPTFVPDLEGLYAVDLEVSDFIGPGTPDAVDVTATTVTGFAEFHIVAACDLISALSPNQVTTKGNQRALCNFLGQAVRAIQKNKLAKAVDKLDKSIIRTDGCPLRGAPDGNGPGRDWITDCAAQNEIYDHLVQARNVLAMP